jgi:fatty-acyl-CoA synthase
MVNHGETLGPALETGAASGRSVTFIEGSGLVPVPWARLHDRARAIAWQLRLQPRAHVAVLGRTCAETVAAIQAAWLAGCVVTVLPLPRPSAMATFGTDVRSRIAATDADILVVDRALAAAVDTGELTVPVADAQGLYEKATDQDTARFERADTDSSATALLQFTSGSTGEPRAAEITHGQLTANVLGILAGMALDPGSDVGVSWLPLFHDMGLIGFLLTPMVAGIELYLASPEQFAASPASWMRWLSRFGGTVTGGPVSAYGVAARCLERDSSFDLSSVRVQLIGAEMIDPGTVRRLCRAGASAGLGPGSPFCAYGLAEATLAVTLPEPGSGMHSVSRSALSDGGLSDTSIQTSVELATMGEPIPGMLVRIVDPESRVPLEPWQVGEVEVSGPSVMSRYYNAPDATRQVLADGWLRTGDLGALADGELVICGRLKDVIIIGGRNIHPEEIERVTGEVPGLRKGNVIAFGVEQRRGREGIVVVAEAHPDSGPVLKSVIMEAVVSAVGIPPADICLIPPRTLPKTSSGKLQRPACKRQYLDGALPQPD